MGVFDPEASPPADPAEAMAAVDAFLARCETWATDTELPKLMARLADDPNPATAAKLHQWTTWAAFVAHARSELRDGTLDRWFTEE